MLTLINAIGANLFVMKETDLSSREQNESS